MTGALAKAIGRFIGLVVGAYLAYVAVRGSRMLVQPDVRPFLPDVAGAPATPGDIGLEYEVVHFTTDDGVILSGWLIPAGRPTKGTVVVMHGFSGHRLPELAGFVPWLHERWNVLQFDFRGHGESGAGQVTLGSHERRDVAAAVAFLRARGYGPIALFGVSMGAAAAILAAPDLPVAAVVADAPYAHVSHPIASRLREQGYPFAGIGARAIVAAAALRARSRLPDPIGAVRRVSPRALLVITPGADQLISRRQGEALFEAAGEPKELFAVEDAGHGDAFLADPDAYRRRVMQFLERHLIGA